MAVYMTQSMSSGIHRSILYYRKSSNHPSHEESGAFTNAAKATYAAEIGVPINDVVEGRYRSGQGVPRNPNAEEI